MSCCVSAFYKFFPLASPEQHRAPLLSLMEEQEIRGTILLAPEGVNGTVAGSDAAIEALHAALEAIPGCAPLARKLSRAAVMPFGRAKVKLKRELISLGESAEPAQRTGTHVPPEEWNALIDREDVVLVDARNRYELHVGRFPGALDPQTENFGELAEYSRQKLDPAQHPKIATYCTGGIRCEKYTAWLLDQGFAAVYQLEGGILNYFERIPAAENRFEGACYVFDERIALGHDLSAETTIRLEPSCGHAVNTADRREVIEGACPLCAEAEAA